MERIISQNYEFLTDEILTAAGLGHFKGPDIDFYVEKTLLPVGNGLDTAFAHGYYVIPNNYFSELGITTDQAESILNTMFSGSTNVFYHARSRIAQLGIGTAFDKAPQRIGTTFAIPASLHNDTKQQFYDIPQKMPIGNIVVVNTQHQLDFCSLEALSGAIHNKARARIDTNGSAILQVPIERFYVHTNTSDRGISVAEALALDSHADREELNTVLGLIPVNNYDKSIYGMYVIGGTEFAIPDGYFAVVERFTEEGPFDTNPDSNHNEHAPSPLLLPTTAKELRWEVYVNGETPKYINLRMFRE